MSKGWLVAAGIGLLVGLFFLISNLWYIGLIIVVLCAIPFVRLLIEKSQEQERKQRAAATQAHLATFVQQIAPEPAQPEVRPPQEQEQPPQPPSKRQWTIDE